MRNVDQPRASAEETAHLSLELGRLLLANGADTAQVQDVVARFGSGLGYELRLLVSYDALLLSVIGADNFRTKIGRHVPAMSVNLSAVEALNGIADEATSGLLDAASARQRLEAVEQGLPAYPRWLVSASLGLTAAGLSKLFGGDWPVFATVYVAGAVGTAVRQQLGRWRFHPLAIPFVAAFVSGIIGGLGMRLHPGALPALCLIAPGMILVPGVPLINGIRDAISNHMDLSLARLAFAVLVVAAIAFGLFAAMVVTGIGIPVAGTTPLLPILEDAVFSIITTVGYVFLFNVKARFSWACLICGLCSHTLRTILMHLGLDVVSGTLIGSMAAGTLAVVFAKGFGIPPATLAFPGVVALVPGSYAFRAVIASLQILKAGGSSSAPLLADAASLLMYTILLSAAIAVGVAIPLAVPLSHFRKYCNPKPIP
jgi:uncharacterized membrane protein YjjP (DUF1212 family)